MKPEITWSLMHPTPLDAGYFRRVLEAARGRRVDSFEICGPCHGLDSGLDGIVESDGNSSEANAAARHNAKALREIVALAHAAGRQVLLWHREVVLPEKVTPASNPELFDPDGDFDFFGEGFRSFIKGKIHRALAACPDMDGIVLTLTEAQYSVIHPQRPDKFPPVEVVAGIASLFTSELQSRGKRFVLRSFGSTPQDYETLLAGAELAARQMPFEIETKATPCDFVPFFDNSPFLRPTAGCSLSIECDGLGEFLGAGYFPADGVEDLIRRVEAGRAAGCSRFVLRIDRTGHSLIDASYAHKLDVFEAAVNRGTTAAREVRAAALRAAAPGREESLRELMDVGWRAVLKTLFVHENLIFHTNPVAPRLKWLKAGGFFGVLGNRGSLASLAGIWSIRSTNPGPPREAILDEKRGAVELVAQGEVLLARIAKEIDPTLRSRFIREWGNLGCVSRAIEFFVSFSLDMVQALQSRQPPSNRFAVALRDYESLFGVSVDGAIDPDSDAIETDLFPSVPKPVDEAWLAPIGRIMGQMIADYEIEYRQREAAFAESGTVDVIIPGGIADDYRTGRIMHASHAFREGDRLVRAIGNRLFPNAVLEFDFLIPEEPSCLVCIDTTGPGTPAVDLAGTVLEGLQEDGPPCIFNIPSHSPKGPISISMRSGSGGILSLSLRL